MSEKKLLLGMHDNEGIGDLYQEMFEGTKEDHVRTLDAMLGRLLPGGPQSQPVQYDWIIMDINLGVPKSYEPGKTIYEIVKPLVDAGQTRFLGISGGEIAFSACNAGIPTLVKPAPEIFKMKADPALYKAFYDTIRAKYQK